MLSSEEKNIFLQDLENEMLEEDTSISSLEDEKEGEKQEKSSSATTIFAAIFSFFLFIVVLLIFILSLPGSDNPIFESFGIEPNEIKTFLNGLVNNLFMGVVVILLLFVAVGIFRGYSLPVQQKKERRGSFIFGAVSGGLIFLSVIAWGGAITFIDAFVVEPSVKENIEILGFESNEKIIAPVDIDFSAENIISQFKRQGEIVTGLRWSKDKGKTFSPSSLNSEYTFQFFQKGIQTITLEVELLSGEFSEYSRSFTVDDATFSMSPAKALQGKKVEFDASLLFNGSAKYLWDFNDDGIFDTESRSSRVTHIFERKGEQTIQLRIESESDAVEKYSRTIVVSADAQKSLDANIVVNNELEGKAPYEVTFFGKESYSEYESIESYVWSIGNSGVKKKGVSVTHIFTKEGIYPVTLTITSESGATDTEEVTLVIEKGNSAPVSIITTKPAFNESKEILEGFIPFEVQFYGNKSTDADENITQYEWIFTDEEENEELFFGDEASKIFRSEGIYKARLRVSDSEGDSSEKELTIVVKEPPVIPIVSAFPESGTNPLIVEFNASASTCKLDGCKILSYEWDFGDGKDPVQAGAFISHQFTEPGSYDVKVTAITNMGERASTLAYISVTQTPFVACFRPSRTEGTAPLTVSFDPTVCSKGDIVKYQWDFGDGFISGKRNPTHTFATEGEYTVILNTFDKDGRVSEMKEVITATSSKE